MGTALLRNVRHAFRLLLKKKGFAAVSILAIALGIGANVAMFSVVWGVMLGPLPYPHYDRMMVIWSKVNGERNALPLDDYLEYTHQSRVLDSFFYSAWVERHMTLPGLPDAIPGGVTSPGEPAYEGIPEIQLGRSYTADDTKKGNERVVILNHRLWVEQFHSDPHVIGKQVTVDGAPYTIIGVRRPSLADKQATGFDTVLAYTYGANNNNWGNGFARLKPGVTLAQAQAELDGITRRIAVHHPKNFPRNWGVSLEPFHNDWLDRKLQRNLWLLLASVGFVLLIACGNVANLLLANGVAREKEMALRLSLGASRSQLFGQMLVESLVLAGVGGVAGIGLAWALTKIAIRLLPANLMPIETNIQIDWTVLLFALGATALSGVIFGCAPALQSLRLDLHRGLKQGTKSVLGGGRIRVQQLLVVLEFALALTCLGAAGLAIRSFWNLSHTDLGFQTGHILTAQLRPPQKPPAHSEQVRAVARRLLDRVAALPGVQHAALSMNVPLGGHDTLAFAIAGRPVSENNRPTADFQLVTPEFLSVFSVRLLHGRFFGEQDRIGTQPVVVVSQTFARRYLTHLDPLASRILLPDIRPHPHPQGPPVEYQIVGVVDDVQYGALTDRNTPAIYVAFWQNPWPWCIVSVRSMIDPSALTGSIRRAGTEAAPGQPLWHFQTMQVLVDSQLVSDRFGAILYATFSLIALVLAALGIYGVMSFAVAQRYHEMGLRMALGAQPEQVVRLVMSNGMRLALIGLAAGVAGAWVVGRLMQSSLYGVSSFDAATLAAVVLILLAAALCANYLPARRATRADPLTALRSE